MPPTFQQRFGPNVTGFMNCAEPGAGDDAPGAVSFLNGLKAANSWRSRTAVPATPIARCLGTAIDGPVGLLEQAGAKLNPWRYNSSSPQHNPKSFDLWIDVTAGSKTNRICNWSDKPLIVTHSLPMTLLMKNHTDIPPPANRTPHCRTPHSALAGASP